TRWRSSGSRPSNERAPGRSRACADVPGRRAKRCSLLSFFVVGCAIYPRSRMPCQDDPIWGRIEAMLGLEELRREVESGAIDTVVCAFTDMQGRLIGKREHAAFFLSESVDHGLEGCNYLLGLDMEMDPQPGYAMASWERGYGDFHLLPDLDTLRRIPWLGRTARRSSPRRGRCCGRRSLGPMPPATSRCSAPSSSSTS